jgi:hypothetical protein
MRLVATACFCLLTVSSSIASEQKVFQDRFDGSEEKVFQDRFDGSEAATPNGSADGVSVRAKDSGMPLDPQPLDQKASELKSGMPAFAVLTEKPISIPQQNGSSDLLQPRALPSPAPKPKQVVNRSTEEVCDTLAQAAQQNKLPTPFFIRLLFQESGFKPGIVSHAGAQGIAQFMPETAASMGLDNPFDPLQAIPASARLLRNLIDKFGNLGLAAAAYNAGPKRINDWLARKSKLPNETQGYVKVITGRPAESWKGTRDAAISTQLPARAPCKETVVASAGNDMPLFSAAATVQEAHARRTHKRGAVAIAAHKRIPVAIAKNGAPAKKREVAVAKKGPASKRSVTTLAARKQPHQRSRLALR